MTALRNAEIVGEDRDSKMESGQHSGDERLRHAMNADDAYRVEQVLSRGKGCLTELVTLDGVGPFVRKKIPASQAHRTVWAKLSECESPHLPHVVAMYETPDYFTVVSSYVPGETLFSLLKKEGAFRAQQAVEVLSQLSAAVSELHAHGIVHCDISPANVIIASEEVYLIDFETAKPLDGDCAHDSRKLGTAGFAAPELYGFARVDERTDVYALGALLGCLLTGVLPSDDAYEQALCDAQSVSPFLCQVVKQACSFEPSARYQTADEVAQAAAIALKGEEPPKRKAVSVAVDMHHADQKANKRGGSSWSSAVRWTLLAVAAAVTTIAVTLAAFQMVSSLQRQLDMAGDSPAVQNADSPSTVPDEFDEVDSVTDSAEDAPLEIVESGWSVEGGYVHYALALRNTSDNMAVWLPEVLMTGRDADGSVLFSDSLVLNQIMPGETQYHGFLTGNGVAPDTVQFEIGQLDETSLYHANEDGPKYTVSNVAKVSGALGDSFTGEVTYDSDGFRVVSNDLIAVTLVLRDDSGAIVYGDSTYVDEPDLGESVAFEISLSSVPSYSTFEVYAYPW